MINFIKDFNVKLNFWKKKKNKVYFLCNLRAMRMRLYYELNG